MEPKFEIIQAKKLIGKSLTMTFGENKTFELWKSLMPRRNEIQNKVSADLISMQVYPKSFDFKNFNLNASFEKWAAVEVANFDFIPDDMNTYTLPGGLYAVFIHKGPASEGPVTFQFIFGKWLPGSGYEIDDRPHFEILGKKYKHDDPESEEEICIPIKKRE